MKFALASSCRSIFCLAIVLTLALPASALAAMATGELTTSDELATDSVGTFYYDVLTITNPGLSDVDVQLTVEAGNSLSPWAAWFAGEFLPDPLWEDGTDVYNAIQEFQSSGTQGSTLQFTPFILPALASYQVAVATYFYNPVILGDYKVIVTPTVGSVTISPVPVPKNVAYESNTRS